MHILLTFIWYGLILWNIWKNISDLIHFTIDYTNIYALKGHYSSDVLT